jgi:prepilin-type N-terminal cleavage/methylation domain-containing protein
MIRLFNKQRGFSLLEMLLVITVLATISVAGVSYLRDKTLNVKLDKTALQMQQWLQASMAYYVDKSDWPADTQALMDDGYIPNDIKYVRSVWYTGVGKIGVYTIGPDTHAKQVVLRLQLPNNVSYEVAQRLAAKMPMADVDLNTKTIMVYGAIPGPGGGGQGAWDIVFIRTEYLKQADNYYDKNALFTAACPAGKEPDLFIIDNGFYNHRYYYWPGYYAKSISERALQVFPRIYQGMLQGWDVHVQTALREACEFKPNEQTQKCKPPDARVTNTSTILLLGVCKPISKAQQTVGW